MDTDLYLIDIEKILKEMNESLKFNKEINDQLIEINNKLNDLCGIIK